ncbi:Subunit of the glycosylphosphatidylinositol transamidase complex-like protein, partial [Ascosphaera acerosa]
VLTTALAFETLHPTRRCYSLPQDFPFDLELLPAAADSDSDAAAAAAAAVARPAPQLYAERTIIGHGQERGGMRSILTNPSPDRALCFVYFEALPWFIRPYLHTLRAEVRSWSNGSDAATGGDGSIAADTALADVVKDIFYRPALDRRRGTQLELVLTVPPASTVTLIYDVEKAPLRYTEYPPDANRGFQIPPAVIRVVRREGEGEADGEAGRESHADTYLRTTTLLVSLPTPDFSMPYNVIILTSTVMALAFGSIFNMLVRRFVTAEEARAASKLPKLKRRVGVVIGRVREKLTRRTGRTKTE